MYVIFIKNNYGDIMSREELINKSIQNAVASVEMEGFHIDKDSTEWCRKVLNNEMTKAEYIALVLAKAGVASV